MPDLRAIRERLGLTQAQLSRITGESQPNISARENGLAKPRNRTPLMALRYLETLPRERLEALLADPSTLED